MENNGSFCNSSVFKIPATMSNLLSFSADNGFSVRAIGLYSNFKPLISEMSDSKSSFMPSSLLLS